MALFTAYVANIGWQIVGDKQQFTNTSKKLYCLVCVFISVILTLLLIFARVTNATDYGPFFVIFFFLLNVIVLAAESNLAFALVAAYALNGVVVAYSVNKYAKPKDSAAEVDASP